MECKKCEWLKRKLSPLEDVEFTARYCLRENFEWLRTQRGTRQGKSAIVVRLRDVWVNTFNSVPNNVDLTTLGRTLEALGWERTRRKGITFFLMNCKEFENVYTK